MMILILNLSCCFFLIILKNMLRTKIKIVQSKLQSLTIFCLLCSVLVRGVATRTMEFQTMRLKGSERLTSMKSCSVPGLTLT